MVSVNPALRGTPAPDPPSPRVAALLSLLEPGLGHAYAGAWRLALAIWLGGLLLGFAGLAVVVRAPSVAAFVALGIAALALTLGVAVHAWRVAAGPAPASRPRGGRLVLALLAFYLGTSLVAAGARLWIRRDVVSAYRAPSEAMLPTIAPGDLFYVVRHDRDALGEDRIVVFHQDGTTYVKRIAALAGDTVAMRAGRLLRNGRAVAEPWAHTDPPIDAVVHTSFVWQRDAVADPAAQARYAPTLDTWGPFVVPARHVFVLGDNRHRSEDSRYIGFVATDSIDGWPTLVYFSRDPDSRHIRWDRIGHALR